jgi:hypothetical protein
MYAGFGVEVCLSYLHYVFVFFLNNFKCQFDNLFSELKSELVLPSYHELCKIVR